MEFTGVMTKKIAFLIAISVCSLIALIYIRYASEDYLSGHIIDNNKFEELKASRKNAEDMDLQVFFDDCELFYDKSSDSFFYSLIDDSRQAYDPSVSVIGEGEMHFAILDKGITDEAIEKNAPITGIFYNDESYCVRNIKCTFLPIMNINCEGEITETETRMNMRLFDNRKQCVVRDMSSDGFIRIRGGNTRSFPKKPLKISLIYGSDGDNYRNNNMSLLGMRKDDDYILYPAYNDAEKVRNVFSQNLWYKSCNEDNAYKVTTGIEYKFLELFVDGQYYGLYALGYTPDEKMIGLSKTDEYAGFYKRVVGIDSGELFVGDYGNLYGWRAENVPLGDRMREYEEKRWKLLIDYLYCLKKNSADPGKLQKNIDVDNAIDYTIFINLIQGDDNLFKNYYLFVREKASGSYYSYYCPWDLDVAWGNMWVPNALNGYLQYGHKPYYNLLFDDLYFGQIMAGNDSAVVEKTCDRFRELRKKGWSDEVIAEMIDEYEKDIFSSGAYLRDKERWPDGNYKDAGEPNNLDKFREYVRERFAEADAYYGRLKELSNEDIFIRRTAQYKNFDNSSFILEINNKTLLQDERYVGLIKRIGGIDISKITGDIKYVIKPVGEETIYLGDVIGSENPRDREISINVGKHVITFKPGEERDYLYEETGYTIYMDGVAYYDAYTDHSEGFVASLSSDGFGEKMNLKRDYRINPGYSTFGNKELFFEAVKCADGKMLILTDNGKRSKKENESDFKEFEISKCGEDNENNVTAYLLDGESMKCTEISGGIADGVTYDTELGKYTCKKAGDIYRISVNGKEILEYSQDYADKAVVAVYTDGTYSEIKDEAIFD